MVSCNYPGDFLVDYFIAPLASKVRQRKLGYKTRQCPYPRNLQQHPRFTGPLNHLSI